MERLKLLLDAEYQLDQMDLAEYRLSREVRLFLERFPQDDYLGVDTFTREQLEAALRVLRGHVSRPGAELAEEAAGKNGWTD